MMRLTSMALIALLSLNAQAAPATLQTSVPSAKTGDDRTFNLRIEPHWLALKELSLDLQIKVGSKFTIGPTIAFMSDATGIHAGSMVAERAFFEDKTTRQSLGLRSAFYFSGADVSSAYLSAFGRYSKVHVKSQPKSSLFADDPNRSGDFNETSAGLTSGYQWIFGRLTLNVGGGIKANNTPKTMDLKGTDGTIHQYELKGEPTSFAFDAGLGFRF